MHKKPKAVIVVMCLLTLLCLSFTSAETLTYKFAPLANEVYQLRGAYCRPNTTPPEGVALPKMTSSERLFGKWDVAQAPNGVLHLAIDSSQNDSNYDRLFVDTNANGSLDDETAITSTPTNIFQMTSAQFGPVEITLQTEHGPITRHFRFDFSQYGDRTWLSITSVCWYQGPVNVDGQDIYCMIFDNNANGTFNDTFLPNLSADQIRIGQKGQLKTVPLSKYVQIDNEYYTISISPTGENVDVSKSINLQFGTIVLPEYITEIKINGENGLYAFTTDDDQYRAPVGKYNITSWTANRIDETGDKWQLRAYASPENTIELLADTETKPDIGDQLTSTIQAQKEGDIFRFNQSLAGKNGERVSIYCNGQRSDAPKLRIKNANGSYNEEFSFEYGWGGTCSLSWREPKNVKGPFTATVDIKGPFHVKSEPYIIQASEAPKAPQNNMALILVCVAIAVIIAAGVIIKKKTT